MMRTNIIVTVATTLVSSTASTQEPSQRTAPIPNLTGTWVYPFCCGFTSPLSGPGPVVNKARMPQLTDADGRRLPPGTNVPLVSSVEQLVGDYNNPILTPQAAEVVKKHGESELAGIPTATPRSQCWPEGVPFALGNMGMQMIQQQDKIIILYDHDHQVRHVRINQPHPERVTPSWYGDSVGRYEGDTLVVDTVGMKIGPFSMIDLYGTPYTQALHVVERYRLIDYIAGVEAEKRGAKEKLHLPLRMSFAGGLMATADYKGQALQLQFTVEDQGVFTMPWSAMITYWRSFDQWPEFVCAQNLHSTYIIKESAVPRSDKPDF
jgi:hypothetical protein